MSDDDNGVGVVRAASTYDNTRITFYTLVKESETSGQRTRDTSVRCNQRGLEGTGCYHTEFLCSGYGVAMQGTGIADNGKYIKYVSGGGGWRTNFRSLNNCDGARFAVVNGVTGSTGRELIEGYSVAVDPRVIPYGSYVWIESLGRWFRADDTGGAIKGNKIDVYVGSQRGMERMTDYGRIFVSQQPHAANDPSPYANGANPVTAGCPATHPVDCGNQRNCCPANFRTCCPDESCSANGSCDAQPSAVVDCAVPYPNGRCCPATLPHLCSSGLCVANASQCGGGGGPPIMTNPSPMCPEGYPRDCGNGMCCPESHSYCCPDGTCSADGNCE
jgi:3D (Asp-Asp-Asp) domain-containing protein